MFSLKSSLWLVALLPSLAFTAPNVSVELIHEFPIGTFIENLVVRPSGSVLAIDFSAPNIFEVPITPNATATLIHTFQNATGVASIAESWEEPDVYFAVTGTFSFETFTPENRSYAIHRLEFDACGKPTVTELAPLSTMIMPNGMITIPETPYLLIPDSLAGIVYRFDTEKLLLTTYLDDPLLKPVGTSFRAGVNGIKLSRGYFYFSNTNQEIVARIPVSGKDATLQGTPEIVATQTLADDFIVNDYNGDIFIAENGLNELGFVGAKSNSTIPETILGGGNSTALFGPTAVRWAKGAEGRSLIVTDTGGIYQYVTGNLTKGGKINLVHLN
ncbi:hypothetical protein G7Y89_g10652 [Cudoniella acicularis]|uniref:SMP-30/Gluconolactonase/LRE-like region domain-containing protein n=1 Tax=Cudoniella acicularis TaxID=354080 RepID=A0A8H4VZ07_9HELO|nr:hypothetical protein G7Y89_g10652 [Cudoniella acicularis]